MPDDREHAGAKDYMAKPFEVDRLVIVPRVAAAVSP
jgi:hypothetical protein